MRIALLPLVAVLTLALPAGAQQQMPNPADMAGRPLPAPELPAGTVSVRLVRERLGNNIAGHPVALRVGGQTRTATTDEQGRAQFTGIAPGTAVTAEAVVDGESLVSQEFGVPVSGGVRVALIAGIEAAAARERAAAEEAAQQPARPGVVVFGGESRVIIEFQDDNLQFFYLLDVVNNARTPIDIGQALVIELPDGAQGAGAMSGSSTQAMVQGDRVRINGPFPPGVTSVQFGFRMPYSGDTLTVAQTWPAAFEQPFVAAEKIGDMRLSSPQLPPERLQERNAAGTPFLLASGDRLNAGDTLTVTLSGLPHQSTMMRDVGVGIGLLVLAAGFWFAFTAAPRSDRVRELTQKRERLMAELVEVEEQRRAGRIDERKYAARRQTLMAQLERVLGELDRAPGGGEGVAA